MNPRLSDVRKGTLPESLTSVRSEAFVPTDF
jgi:hypothetical protein